MGLQRCLLTCKSTDLQEVFKKQYNMLSCLFNIRLLAKRPSAAMSEEKRLPFAGYSLC